MIGSASTVATLGVSEDPDAIFAWYRFQRN